MPYLLLDGLWRSCFVSWSGLNLAMVAGWMRRFARTKLTESEQSAHMTAPQSLQWCFRLNSNRFVIIIWQINWYKLIQLNGLHFGAFLREEKSCPLSISLKCSQACRETSIHLAGTKAYSLIDTNQTFFYNFFVSKLSYQEFHIGDLSDLYQRKWRRRDPYLVILNDLAQLGHNLTSSSGSQVTTDCSWARRFTGSTGSDVINLSRRRINLFVSMAFMSARFERSDRK